MWRGMFDLFSGPVRAVGVEIGAGLYEPDLDRDATLADIPVEARKAFTEPLLDLSVDDGVVDAEDTELDVPSEERVDALVLYVEGDTEETSDLLCLLSEGRGLPLTGNGVPVDLTWPNTADRIVRLA